MSTKKFLCFSDLHRDVDAAHRLVEMSEDVDFVIGAGDFANRHVGLADTLGPLSAIKTPTLLVPGNGETAEALKDATADWSAATVLHGAGTDIDGQSFWGVGGGIPVTPFGEWSYDFDENAAASMLAGCPGGAVLVVHSPPLDTVDADASGKIRGSSAIRDCVVAKQPKLVVCGHIHSCWTQRTTLGSSHIINAGPLGVVLTI